MRYEWDKVKNRANIARHGIDFADAVAVFEDTLALTRPDSESRAEPRYVPLGIDAFNRHLVVIFTEHEAVIRIISARMATTEERKYYEN